MRDESTNSKSKPDQHDEPESSSSFRFIVTGFGPFNGVPDNPTSILAKELVSYLRQKADCNDDDNDNDDKLATNNKDARMLADCTDTMIVETSAQAARHNVALIQKKLEPYKSAIILHLGVDAGGTSFKLESCAYNDATFRVPDESGYRPDKEPILDTCALGSTLTTSVDVAALVETMNNNSDIGAASNDNNGSLRAHPSTDPGRFVCNYIYCTSMDAFACAKTINGEEQHQQHSEQGVPRIQSLFLHVPPFECVPKDEQLKFVTELMSALYQQKHQVAVEKSGSAAALDE